MQERRRILIISAHGYVAVEPELGPPDTAGQLVSVLQMSKCLARPGFEVDIFTRCTLPGHPSHRGR